MGSPIWIKTKKATINPVNKDDKCFQSILTLNYQKISVNSRRILSIKPL